VKAVAGVISDTHGLVRPEVKDVFRNVDVILHAGDIGSIEVLNELRSLAPVVAVRGNNDKGDWANAIPETEMRDIGGAYIYLLHDLNELDLKPSAAGIQVVISGHSHKPLIEKRGGVLFLNPGSAGPRRFKLPVTVARLTIDGNTAEASLIPLLT
jgi:putative phosphoesterase